MDFAIFPFVMIMACVVVMVLMMRRMGPVYGGRWAGRRYGADKWDAVD
jgi:hypothetical protein